MQEGWKAEPLSRIDIEPYHNVRELDRYEDFLDIEAEAAVEYLPIQRPPDDEISAARKKLATLRSRKSSLMDPEARFQEAEHYQQVILQKILNDNAGSRNELFEAVRANDASLAAAQITMLRQAVSHEPAIRGNFNLKHVASADAISPALRKIQKAWRTLPERHSFTVAPAEYRQKTGDPTVQSVFHWIPEERADVALKNGLLPGFLTGHSFRSYVYAHVEKGNPAWTKILHRNHARYLELEIEHDPEHTYMWLMYALDDTSGRIQYKGDNAHLVSCAFTDLSTQVAARLRADEKSARYYKNVQLGPAEMPYFSALLGRNNPTYSALSPYNWEESEVLLDFVPPARIKLTGNVA
ncbi:MAG: hypothetical protein ACREGH_04230 [Minisyncoccia bacterium]